MSATKRALELGRRRQRAAQRLMKLLEAHGACTLGVWNGVLSLQRAAMACGEERERRRHEKKKGRKP